MTTDNAVMESRPRASLARQHAYAMLEEAYALRLGDAKLFDAVEAVMRAAHDEGAAGVPYIACYKSPVQTPGPATISKYRVLEAKGAWPHAPWGWIVMRPEATDLTGAIALCTSKEDAELVAAGLAKP